MSRHLSLYIRSTQHRGGPHRFIFGNSFEITAVFVVASPLPSKVMSVTSPSDVLLFESLVKAVEVVPPVEKNAGPSVAVETGGGATVGGTFGDLTGSIGDPCRDRGCINLSGFSGVGDATAFASNLARPFATAPGI